MTKIRKSTKLLAIVATILVIAFSIMLVMAFGEDAYAEDEFIPAEDNIVIESEEPTADGGNWLAENWKILVEIFTGSAGLALIGTIIKVIGKISTLKKELGNTKTDNTAIKSAFNDMADEIEAQTKRCKELEAQNTLLLNKIEVIENKCSATLTIFERLISSSDLPVETKVALQGVINKADEKESNSNDEE